MAKQPNAMSLKAFQAWLPNEAAAVAYFEKVRWNGKPCCPYCESDDVLRIKSGKPMSFRCRACRKHFSVKTGSVMQSSKIEVRTWLIAMYLMSVAKKGVSSCQISRQLGIRQATAWFLCQRIRKAWNQWCFLLDGEGEMDEIYMGGKERNNHSSKKLRAGCGAVGKVPVVGLSNGRMYAVVSATPSKKVLPKIIDEQIRPSAKFYTDDNRGYIGAPIKSHVA